MVVNHQGAAECRRANACMCACLCMCAHYTMQVPLRLAWRAALRAELRARRGTTGYSSLPRTHHQRCRDVDGGHAQVVDLGVTVHGSRPQAAARPLCGDDAASALQPRLELVEFCVVKDRFALVIRNLRLQKALLIRAARGRGR